MELPRRCENCRKWAPAAGRRPGRGECSDPAVRRDPSSAGIAGYGLVEDLERVTTRRDAVCPRFEPVPVRFRR